MYNECPKNVSWMSPECHLNESVICHIVFDHIAFVTRICHIALVTLHFLHCICHIALATLYLSHWICRFAFEYLMNVSWMLKNVSCIINFPWKPLQCDLNVTPMYHECHLNASHICPIAFGHRSFPTLHLVTLHLSQCICHIVTVTLNL